MPRLASGDNAVLIKARDVIANARTVGQLRQAQAVVLPLDYGLSLQDTARIIGVSRGWACQLRRRFMQGKMAGAPDTPARGGRHRQNMTLENEREFLAPFVAQVANGGVLVVSQIKTALEQQLGRKVALASAYNLLHRHGWGKLAPGQQQRALSDPAPKDKRVKTLGQGLRPSAPRAHRTKPSG